jgi:tetratricopeptide (TPR) repeat protein
MKKSIALCAALLAAAILASCATAPASGDAVPLDTAIQLTVEQLNAAFPAGTRLALARFDSLSPELSAYVMDEIAGQLVMAGKLAVVDRKNMEYIQKEMHFQETNASDDTAASIGKMLGAQSIVTGSLEKLGNRYRYRMMAIAVESGASEAALLKDVRGDTNFDTLLSALDSGQKTADLSYQGTQMALVPKTAYDYLNRGLIFAVRGDFDTALEDFSQAITLDPALALAYLQRGKVLFAQQSDITEIGADFELGWTVTSRDKTEADAQAVSDFTQAIKSDPNLGAAYFYRGSVHTAIKEYDKAIADCTLAIKLNPNYASAYNSRGLAYVQLGEYDRAIADYTQATKLDPNYASAYNNRGNAYADKGDDDRAIADYTQAIKLDPNYANAYYNRGIAYRSKGDYDRAIADFTQANKLNPNYANAYNNRGIAYEKKGDNDRVIADYTQAIKLDPNYANAYYNRGNVYYSKGDYDRAIADFTQAIKLDPNHASAYYNRGIAYRSKGDDDQAIADFTQALKLNPNHANAYYSRGNVYYRKADYDKAIADYTQVIKLDPNNAGAKEQLEKAKQQKAAAGKR